MTDGTKSSNQDHIKRPPAIRFDWRDWLPYIAEIKGTDAEKQELIETLYTIVLGFVDLGFGLNPDPKICGEVIDLTALLQADVVNLSEQSKPAFNAAGSALSDAPATGGRS